MDRGAVSRPKGLKWGTAGWDGVAVVWSSEARLDIDLSIPTDCQLTKQRLTFLHHSKNIIIFELVCAWEPLVLERQDLATQWPGWSVKVVPVVVESLGAIGCLREEFVKLGSFSSREILWLVQNVQFEALCSGVRMKYYIIMAWTWGLLRQHYPFNTWHYATFMLIAETSSITVWNKCV